jgi:HlyD family secretion protein
MRKNRKILLLVAAAAAIVIPAIATYFGGNGNGAQYTTATIDRADIQQSVSASGTLNPVKLVNIGTQISGVVQKLHADFNAKVEEGQILAELDQSLIQAQIQQSEGALASAEAKLKQARANFTRVEALFNKKYVAKADLDLARQELETAEAQVKIATGQVERDRVNLGYTIIKSPVSGIVISRAVDVGQTVAASFQTPTLFVIAQDLKQMEIYTSLSEADVGGVKEGMQVNFTVDAFVGRKFEGKVRQIRLNTTTVQNVVTYNVVIDVDNEDLTLLPGMTAFVTLIQDRKENVLRVPNAALSYRPANPEGRKPSEEPAQPEQKAVYLLSGSRPERVEVKTGISDNKFTEVLEGLKEGDIVVTQETTPGRKPAGGNRQGGPGGMRLF